MTANIIMPKLGMNMKEGTVVEWLRKEHDHVNKGDPIAVISSDKIEKELETPQDGYLISISAKENDVVPIGTTLGVVGERDEMVAPQGEDGVNATKRDIPTDLSLALAQSKEKTPTRKVLISPSARKLALSLGIEVDRIQGTGPNGRITNDDITKAADKMVRADLDPVIKSIIDPSVTSNDPVKPLSTMRKMIANRLKSSLQDSAQLTITMSADITELQEVRRTVNTQISIMENPTALSVTDFIARAAALAMQAFPEMNSTLINNELHLHEEVHLGIAVSLQEGLVVPVVRNAGQMSVSQLSERIRSLGTRAREQKLEAWEMTGSTFSITNLGRTGIQYFTPILNPPETGILGIGTSAKNAVLLEDGSIVGRELLPLSLTFDHRVMDGNPASEFLAKVKFFLENPLLMLI